MYSIWAAVAMSACLPNFEIGRAGNAHIEFVDDLKFHTPWNGRRPGGSFVALRMSGMEDPISFWQLRLLLIMF